jgi:hypothetical protein
MTVRGEDDGENCFRDRKMNPREVSKKYGRLVVFIRHDYAEIWGLRYGLTLGIGTLKIMASTGVFMRVICDLKRSISSDARTSSIILTSRKHKHSRSYQKNDLSKYFAQGRQRIKQSQRQPRIVVD